ncbi:alpha/beta hydrolase [Marinomonas sp. 15G1-11]|uniref:Alpha/beta hydrolase n=1 Tax=Marinomonas phaeophyticola TaxID=3004091 RepID=A0ABT4JSY7_9GAMM|nr:alpha/beta hydrolase [Marinomonas sp. 15G1-11]MCZ2721510.1 alpha/beta hydrolase [Marinomonas sp. 15G1-11]
MKSTRLFQWQQISDTKDFLGGAFRSRGFQFPGPKSHVVCHLINDQSKPRLSKAILYLHGYTDYFFQAGLSKDITDNGYGFYALDLQGYGRSIRPYSPPNDCDSLAQYFDDLNIALDVMQQDGVLEVVILAHSTGGLIASRFLQERQRHDQDKAISLKITGLILNSPFICLPFPPEKLQVMTSFVRILTGLFPFYKKQTYEDKLYAKTLHKKFGGEWEYRLDFKPSGGFYLSFKWLHEIIQNQKQLTTQAITLSTLLCCSQKSTYKATNSHDMAQGDGALDVESMKITAQSIYTDLRIETIPQGFHDLYLSPIKARQHYLTSIFNWLSTLEKSQE